MKILLTGAKGQLGTEMQRESQTAAIRLIPVDLAELDITNFPALEKFFTSNSPDLVVNAAAFTAVDKAESERELAFAVNRDGPKNLALLCSGRSIPLIHISTDYVFDGTKTDPYNEDDQPNPLSIYGKSKNEGDLEVQAANPKHIIIRTSWVYSPFGQNFVKTILKLARERETLKIIDDQHGSPTAARDLAQAIWRIIRHFQAESALCFGMYHFCGGGTTSWHGFAQAIVEEARKFEPLKVKSIEPIPTSAYPLPAPRPKNSKMNCSKFEKTYKIVRRNWREALSETIKELYK